MRFKTWLGTCILSALVGAYLVYKLRPPETKIVEKEVVHETTKVITVRKITKEPDGTTITESTTTADKQVDETKNKTADIVANTKKWIVSGGANTNKIYEIQVQRNLFANVYIGAGASSSGIFNVLVGVSF